MPRYRFADFVVSPRRRTLARAGREQTLIPRYFDLLVFLIERRHEAVHRRDIFDRVWSDVVVSDSALSQAVRTIRRALEDDPREPRFIRTVSRHGYRFVYAEVVEDDDEAAWPYGGENRSAEVPQTTVPGDQIEPLLERLAHAASSAADEEEQGDAAELLHTIGTADALQRLGTRPGHAHARALLRDSRWEVARAGDVPVLGQPAPLSVASALVRLRLRRAARVAAARWMSASIGGGVAGLFAGSAGGLLLALAPGSAATLAIVPVLALIGAVSGAAGGAAVGAGMSVAETVARTHRALALAIGAALGGGLAGSAAQWLGQWSLTTLVGLQVEIGGQLEGVVIGGAAGLGFALATLYARGGLAAPQGRSRWTAAMFTAIACGLGALSLTWSGRPLVGGTIHNIAQASRGAQAVLTPLGRLIGEPDFGQISRIVVGTSEGALFGLGLALGLTHRPKS